MTLFSINITKEIIRRDDSWCSCCGESIPKDTEIIRVQATGLIGTSTHNFSRLIKEDHFLSWLKDKQKRDLPFFYRREEIQKREK